MRNRCFKGEHQPGLDTWHNIKKKNDDRSFSLFSMF